MENKIPITIDNNSNLGYEKGKIYFLIIPLMWILAILAAIKKKIFGHNLKINSFLVDGISPVCKEIKETSTSWRALDIIYNYEFKKRKGIEGKITDFWLNILNSQASRNRLRLIKQKLRETIKELIAKESKIRLLSIASGSAQGVIDIIKEFKQEGIIITAIFLDLDLSAIEHSKELAKKAKVIEQITFINKSVRELEEIVKGFNPNIIEIVGFLEYRSREKAIELTARAYRLLTPNGILLMSTISNSLESFFLYYVMNWPMIYRSPKQFAEIIIKGGFNSKNSEIICEPLKIQKIAVCRKFIS